MSAAAPQPSSSGSHRPSSQPSHSERPSRGGGKPPPRGWFRTVVSGALVAITTIAAFHTSSPSILQSSFLAALFSSGLAGLTWGLLPGEIKFKKGAVTAVGAIALFLAVLYWLMPDGLPGCLKSGAKHNTVGMIMELGTQNLSAHRMML